MRWPQSSISSVLAFLFPRGNEALFYLLIIGEVFHLWQVFTFLYTVWDTKWQPPRQLSWVPSVDVFITVAGEPVELVRETLRAALRMRYPRFEVYLLNDGYVAKKENWLEIETLAARGGRCSASRARSRAERRPATSITRSRLPIAPLVAIFDADHVPHGLPREDRPYFTDEKVGFVQTPQFYKNANQNYLTRGSWEQQELFFGPICRGKNRLNSATMCGTNMLLSRRALEASAA
jgi:cellulose synthase (UDP-forming)